MEAPNLTNTRTDQFSSLLSGQVKLEGEQFPVLLPVHHILTATIDKGEMRRQGAGRFVEYLAELELAQTDVTSRVKLIRDLTGQMIWTPSCFELAGPYLSRFVADLFETAGRPVVEMLNCPPDAVIDTEVERFLRLASNQLKR